MLQFSKSFFLCGYFDPENIFFSKMKKINIFRGVLTDISARKTPLVETHRLDDGSDGSIDSFVTRSDLIDDVSEDSSAPRSFINVRAL